MSNVLPPHGNEQLLSADLFRALLESSPEGILCVAEDGVVLFANQCAESIFRSEPGALTGTRLELLLPDCARTAHRGHAASFSSHPRIRKKRFGLYLAGRRRDGSEFAADISLSYAETALGRVALAFIVDVSASRALEEQLAQLQEMEAVGSLVGGLAHDLSNILTAIIGSAYMADGEIPTGSAASRWLEQTIDAAQRASDLCRRLLTFSRPQETRLQIADPNSVVFGTVQMMRRLIGENIELDLLLGAGLPDIRIDVGRLERSLVNLLVNARDAIPDRGKILVQTRLEVDDPSCPQGRIAIAVSDTGMGMEESVRKRIFEPSTTEATGRGTGHGLMMVHSAISQAGGEIRVDSEPGRGTTFTLLIPAVDAPADEAQSPPGRHARGYGAVLLVEDEGEVLNLLSLLLARIGFEVLEARTADEAREIFLGRFEAIRALITDVVLPGKSGVQLAVELRSVNSRLPVLFLSGYGEHAAEFTSAVSSNSALLSKPFTPGDLARMLWRLLDQATQGQEGQHER